MDAQGRRDRILRILNGATSPVSASRLAGELGVSRQIIVGDIALIRATGVEILATARGYMAPVPRPATRFVQKIACQHTLEQTEQELSTIVAMGGEVLDVVVEHFLYGEIVGQLGIAAPADVADFIRRVKHNETRLLSELTGGVHLHTVSCRDKDTFDAISARLGEMGLLYQPG